MQQTAPSASCDVPNNNGKRPYDTLSRTELDAGRFTPEVMWKMGRVSHSSLSPDGTMAVYEVTHYCMDENRGCSSIYVVPLSGGEPELLADGTNPQWSGDGNKVRFLAPDKGCDQLWSIDRKGGEAVRLTDIAGGIESFGVAPTEDRLFYVTKVKVENTRSADRYPDMDKSKADIYDDLMVRHWNYWNEGEYRHIFVADMVDGKAADGTDIMPNEPWDAPMSPYFDASEIAWNHAGTRLAYTYKKLSGREYATSTDSDIYIYDTLNGHTVNICRPDKPLTDTKGQVMELVGYDRYPLFSPDDSMVAFRSMERAGNESDRERVMVWDSRTGTVDGITSDFAHSATCLMWDGNARLYFISPIEGTLQLCRAEVHDHLVETVTAGDHDINAATMACGTILCEVTRLDMATELFVTDHSGKMRQLTFTNREIYEHMAFGEVRKRMVTTSDGHSMLTWVVLPPDFDEHKAYPTLLYCQGGPQNVVSQFWSYRWNLELMAAKGYVVVAPNRRGVPSFGMEWLDQISGDYGGRNISDYLDAIDDVSREPWCDSEHLGAVGASYGGYSVFKLAGCHQRRFKAFIAHCGVFNFESMYGETEELWFMNRDYGGPYWEYDNPTAMRSYAASPHKSVDKWDTPILIFTGENDYRIPYTQSLQAFTAARMRGIPSRLVVLRDEAHQVFKPQNSIVWNREFFGWLNRYLKTADRQQK